MRQLPQSNAESTADLNALVADFTQRLTEAAERASAELGEQIIRDIFAAATGQGGSARERTVRRRAERERARLVAGLTKQLLAAIESGTRSRTRELLSARRRELAASAAAEKRATSGLLGSAVRPRRRRKPVRPGPPPLDPEQIKRDAEFARLRALLKPVAEEPAPAPAPSAPLPPARELPRPNTPGEVLRALEKEIQEAVPSLGRLGPERCAAQIAVWTGQVRDLRDRLPPDVAATMRPAFRIFMEHLTQLRVAMEAQVVDALEPTFIAPDWEIYIEANRATVEQRPPNLPDDKLQVHHRTMLRALVLPYRRNANKEAIAIIEAASRALPPNDPQLQSALRRFASLWKSRGGQAEAGASVAEPVEAPPSPPAPPQETPPEPAEPKTEPTGPEPEAAPAESEFDSPWTK